MFFGMNLKSVICLSSQPDLMKVRINSTSLWFDLAYYLYAEIDFVVHMIRNG